MEIEYDDGKRRRILEDRGLDLGRAREVFAGLHRTYLDDRRDYGEVRWFTIGFLDDRMVLLVWTPRGATRRVISMRKTNDRESRKYLRHLR